MPPKNEIIATRVLPGFMELLPRDQIAFNKMLDKIRSVYEQYGFLPIDTPVIERADVIFAKIGGETAKQIYRFNKGDNDLALRFDLTVPLARYVAEHSNDLVFPFKRYHIGKVYRGENPQKGRFREFYQCDIDIIGNESLNLLNDAEVTMVIYDVFKKLDIGKFVIRVNNRKLITGILNSVGIGDLSVDIMRLIDKIEKIGEDAVRESLSKFDVSEEILNKIFNFLSIKGNCDEVLNSLYELNVDDNTFRDGLSELQEVIKGMRMLGVPDNSFAIDLSIARGLDYYTGTVYETVLSDFPEIGSVCSGGRYDNLAEKYIDRKLPGVGISIGLTRLFSQLKMAGLIKDGQGTLTKTLIIPLTDDYTKTIEVASYLRNLNIASEIYFEGGKMKKKMTYADRAGFPYVILIGEEEILSNQYTLRNMKTGEQIKLNIGQIPSYFSEKD